MQLCSSITRSDFKKETTFKRRYNQTSLANGILALSPLQFLFIPSPIKETTILFKVSPFKLVPRGVFELNVVKI